MTNGELIGTCGPDPDGSQLCQAWTCGPDNACVLVDNPDCCAGEPQGPSETCDDSDPCTIDLCMGTGLCKHIATTAAGCSP